MNFHNQNSSGQPCAALERDQLAFTKWRRAWFSSFAAMHVVAIPVHVSLTIAPAAPISQGI
jgi:hypothetical protein